MNERLRKTECEMNCKTGRISDACIRYGVGITSMRNIAREAGAVVRIGRSYLINYSRVDAYMDSLSGEE
ncbi:DUF6462 family protein [Candidatus Merdisoma sp. HCP28S3_D10]|uniref:DUF6462 family protein n=2 Tax=unclassified Candidatus Merdisoma TaxID=3099611 RepID=UPI003F89279B